MEASETSFKAHFTAILLHIDLLALILLVSVVKLRDLPNDPESLAFELLLKIGIK
jgi:hypothetical protein